MAKDKKEPAVFSSQVQEKEATSAPVAKSEPASSNAALPADSVAYSIVKVDGKYQLLAFSFNKADHNVTAVTKLFEREYRDEIEYDFRIAAGDSFFSYE